MKTPFWKYEGAGNDFIVLAASSLPSGLDPSELCNRRRGVGADGLLLYSLIAPRKARLLIYNADGSRPAMCGNGLRCLIAHLTSLEGEGPFVIETDFAPFRGEKRGDLYAYEQPLPVAPCKETLLVGGESFTGYFVDTGVPHFVLFMGDEEFSVPQLGKELSTHPHFAPHGTNVTFVREKGGLKTSFFERGVGETPACGTGIVAAGYTAHLCRSYPGSLELESGGGDLFSLEIGKQSLFIAGPARLVFRGEIPSPEQPDLKKEQDPQRSPGLRTF